MVVVTTSANGTGFGYTPAATRAGDVGHVDEQVGTDFVGNGAEAREVEDLRVGAEAGDDHLRLVLNGQALDFVVVDQAGDVSMPYCTALYILPEKLTLAPWVR